MNILDLSILQKKPELNLDVIIEIEPLAPLSMVTELPGAYYKTLKCPDKKMLCGLFENTLGWHLDIVDRRSIIKELVKIRKKQNLTYNDEVKGSTFTPLLMEYFEIELTLMPSSIYYDDLWSKAYRRADAIVHPKGTFNISYDLIPNKRELPRNEKNAKQVDDKAMEGYFKENLEGFPQYYSTPTNREYVSFAGALKLKLTIDPVLYELLQEKLKNNNINYLGNSEGWVNVKFGNI